MKSLLKDKLFIESLIDDEVLDWYSMSPAERFVESQKLWEVFILFRGNYDPEPDTQSPFHIFETYGRCPADRRTGKHSLRGSRV